MAATSTRRAWRFSDGELDFSGMFPYYKNREARVDNKSLDV